MIKKILLAVLVVMPLLGKNSPQEAELMAKLNKLESISQEIAEKEKRIDQLVQEGSQLFNCISYGYDDEQKKTICSELNKLEQLISHALTNNNDRAKAIREQICPHLTVHRNELNRMQHMTVRMCVEYFFLMKLYQQYNDVVDELMLIQLESQR